MSGLRQGYWTQFPLPRPPRAKRGRTARNWTPFRNYPAIYKRIGNQDYWDCRFRYPSMRVKAGMPGSEASDESPSFASAAGHPCGACAAHTRCPLLESDESWVDCCTKRFYRSRQVNRWEQRGCEGRSAGELDPCLTVQAPVSLETSRLRVAAQDCCELRYRHPAGPPAGPVRLSPQGSGELRDNRPTPAEAALQRQRALYLRKSARHARLSGRSLKTHAALPVSATWPIVLLGTAVHLWRSRSQRRRDPPERIPQSLARAL